MPEGFSLWLGLEWSVLRYKRVRPIFVEEPNEIVVITVYVYYL